MPKIDAYLKKVVELDGSDLHLTSTVPAKVRVHGRLAAISDKPMAPDALSEILFEFLDESRASIYRERNDVDLAYELPGSARFRVSLSQTLNGPAAVFRVIPTDITSLKDLGVPPQIQKFTALRHGLVLVTGPTGSGKSTTLAALLDHINRTQQKHIITIEEPIEFVHVDRRSYFTQREVGVDAEDFSTALRTATRQDPDVLLVGELRDPETIGLAITAAEMGILVFATLHTNSAAKTVDRMIDVFPESQQNQVRTMLAESLRGVCAQVLLPTRGGKGRVPANEVLFGSFALSSIIREGNVAKIVGLIESGRGEGMQLMDDSLMERLKAKEIAPDTAHLFANQKQLFERFLSKS